MESWLQISIIIFFYTLLLFLFSFLFFEIIKKKKVDKNHQKAIKTEMQSITSINFKTEKEMDEAIKELVINSSINSSTKKTIDFNVYKIETSSKESVNIAWKAFVLLTTSVITNDSRGKEGEAVDSVFNTFLEIKKMIINSGDNQKLVSIFLLNILNKRIRPFLTFTRVLFEINNENKNIFIEGKETAENKKIFWEKIDDIRKSFIVSNDLRLLSLFARGGYTKEEINEFLNIEDKFLLENSKKEKLNEEVLLEAEKSDQNME